MSGGFVDLVELGLELFGVELGAVDVGGDFEVLVLAEDDNVLVLGWVVFDGVVAGFGGDAAGVEHPFVGGHGHGHAAHVLGFEGFAVDLAFEV